MRLSGIGWRGALLIMAGCSPAARPPAVQGQMMCRDRAYFETQAERNSGVGDWGAACDQQEPCKVGLACFGRRCEPLPECCSDAECPYGCHDGRCRGPVPHRSGPTTSQSVVAPSAAPAVVPATEPADVESAPAGPTELEPQLPDRRACMHYGPVVLEGIVEVATFPGPPNYKSIANGDRKETSWILHVSRPFCVDASLDLSGNIDAAARAGVRKVQLVFLGYEGSDPRVFPGKTVRATGEALRCSHGSPPR